MHPINNSQFSHDYEKFVFQPQPPVQDVTHQRKPFSVGKPKKSDKPKKDIKKQKDQERR